MPEIRVVRLVLQPIKKEDAQYRPSGIIFADADQNVCRREP
jgi:hypothetical protein